MVVMSTAPTQASNRKSIYKVEISFKGEGTVGQMEALTFYSYNISRTSFL